MDKKQMEEVLAKIKEPAVREHYRRQFEMADELDAGVRLEGGGIFGDIFGEEKDLRHSQQSLPTSFKLGEQKPGFIALPFESYEKREIVESPGGLRNIPAERIEVIAPADHERALSPEEASKGLLEKLTPEEEHRQLEAILVAVDEKMRQRHKAILPRWLYVGVLWLSILLVLCLVLAAYCGWLR